MRFVPNAITNTVGRQMLRVDRSSPSLLFGVGVVGMIGSTVLACRATMKLQEVVETAQSDLHVANSLEHLDDGKQHTHRDTQKDVAYIYTRSAVRVAKLYGPSILLGAASVGCLTKSHSMLNQRNLALTAAYAAVDKAFGEYRARVIDKYGEDEDREFRYSMEEVEIIDDKGKVRVEQRVGPDGASMYARFFDEYSTSWNPQPEYNTVFLQCQQKWANDMLKTRGHVFLNEVYDSLGLDRTTAGSVVGWVISKDDGDNYIDFGVFNPDGSNRHFVNGREGSILLDFNVDGIIYDKIDHHKESLVPWQKR